jgi:signal transduction histidine kinase/CheY-like chemotaxis protein/HPt (histidine-containing phosphotransfer) domain-containing protein
MQIPRPLQPIDFVAIVSLASAFVGYLARYHRTGEMLDWWTTASLSINVVGQLLMLLSPHTFDLYFFSALAYKALGYMVPLIGFFLYQIIVVLEYDRNRRDLITAREEALAASRVKSEFLANMSHEIRTPMNGVLGMTQRTLQTSLTTEQRDQLLAVYDSASSLLTLLDDILDFSKMEAGKFAIDPADFSLRACVDSAVRGLRTSAQDKGLELAVTIEPDLPDHYRGDARRLRQVLVNLIGNAIKFTRTGRIDVRVRRSLSVGTLSGRTLVRFEVIDTGIGIPRDKQEVIFEAFSQADGSTTRRFGGTGLGLAISSELVRMMGGRLGVESQPGQGSTFAFELLLPPAQAPPTFPAESILPGRTYQSQRPGTILVADDNEINRRLTTTALCDMGHRVLVACDGAEVIERYRDQSIDLILMDLQMPEVSGLEATKQIRRSEQGTGKHLPIIALTAHAMSDDRQRCLDAGMDDYLSKPVGDDALFAAVEKQLAGEPTPVGIFDDGPANPSRFDRARVIDRVRGDWALLRELVTIFDEQSSQLVQQWNDARTAGDLPALARSAHQLAGSAGNFQATRLIEQARQLERDAQQGLAPSADRWTALMSEWSQLRKELAEWISEQPTTEKLAGNKVGSVEPEVSRRTTSTLPPSSPA